MYLVTSSDVQPTGSACIRRASSYFSVKCEEAHRNVVVLRVNLDTRTSGATK